MQSIRSLCMCDQHPPGGVVPPTPGCRVSTRQWGGRGMQVLGAACQSSMAAQGCATATAKSGPVAVSLGATLHLRV